MEASLDGHSPLQVRPREREGRVGEGFRGLGFRGFRGLIRPFAEANLGQVGALITKTGFWGSFTIFIIRNPSKIVLVVVWAPIFSRVRTNMA